MQIDPATTPPARHLPVPDRVHQSAANRLGEFNLGRRGGEPGAVQLLQRLRRNPPCVAFSPTIRRDGTKKDTLLNIEEVGEFVINVATEETAERMNRSSTELPRGINEFEFAGLTPLPAVKVRPPRVAESPIHLECKLLQIVPHRHRPVGGEPNRRGDRAVSL